jgi:type IV pilus assembly protein PilW
MRRAGLGFSLIELMIGLAIGMLVMLMIGSFFNAQSAANRRLAGHARALENGRFAMDRLTVELKQSGAQYCSHYANLLPQRGITPVRPLLMAVAAQNLRPAWIPPPPPGTAQRYPVDPMRLLRAHDCAVDGSCLPELPDSSTEVNLLPPAGVAAGMRAPGTDVLTFRYLRGGGQSIFDMAAADAPIDVPGDASAAPLSFIPGDLALIADCGSAEIIAVLPDAGDLRHAAADGNFSGQLSRAYRREHDARVHHFGRDFISVSWFVAFKDDAGEAGRLIPGLYRMVNGGEPVEIVEGVERFDLNLAVVDGEGMTHMLTAADIDANPAGLACPPVAPGLVRDVPGCLWRAVIGVEVSALFNSVRDAGQTAEVFHYAPDGPAPQALTPDQLLPIGIPAERLLRREFVSFVNLRNANR